MRSHLGLATAAALAISVLVLPGCQSSRPAPAPVVPQPKTVRQTPTPIPEETITQPTPVPSVASGEQLPSDIAELNKRGYLKDVFFATDSYDLTPEARNILTANAAWLGEHPTIKILIEGHCDERNTRQYNLALGQRRADAVRDYLVFLGVPASRIKTISYGEERPFALGHNEAAWRLNRRAHFVITAR